MTNKEAIELLQPDTTRDAIRTLESHGVDREQIIKKIEEACEIACEALEKQIPKKPKRRISRVTEYCICPWCTVANVVGRGWKYCPECGQKLDWGEEE